MTFLRHISNNYPARDVFAGIRENLKCLWKKHYKEAQGGILFLKVYHFNHNPRPNPNPYSNLNPNRKPNP